MSYHFKKPVFRNSDLPTGLVGYWKFNNDATDSSGKGYDLTAGAGAAAPTFALIDYWKSGEYSTEFTASDNEYYTVTRNADLDCLNAFTIAGWIYADDITSVAIVDKDSAGNGYGVQLDGSSKLVLNMNNGARATSATAVAAGRWTPFAVVYDQVTARVYLDGNLENSAAYTTDCEDAAVDFRLGSLADGSLDFDGKLKDLAIWSVALTPLQVKSLALGIDLSKYAYRPNNVSTAPTVWLKGNEVSGNAIDTQLAHDFVETSGTIAGTGGYIEGVSRLIAAADTEYFTCADHADWDIATDVDFGWAAWIKLTSSAAVNPIISRDGNNDYELSVLADNTLNFDIGNATILTSTTTVPDSTWTHVAIVRKSGTAYLYIDGIEADSAADTTAVATTNAVNIGYDGTVYFDGALADICYWKTYGPTAAEIKSLACALPIQRQGIVLYSKMNQTSGNETAEIGGQTLVNTSVGTVAGEVSNARLFVKATPSYFTIANSAALDLSADASIIGWAKPTGTDYGAIIAKDYSGNGYGILWNGLGYLEGVWNGGSRGSSAAGLALTAGAWNHFAIVFDQANFIQYVGGVVKTTDAYSTNNADTGTDITIGSLDNHLTAYGGGLDEFLIIQRYFRPEEIKAVYLKGLNGKEITTNELPTFKQSPIML